MELVEEKAIHSMLVEMAFLVVMEHMACLVILVEEIQKLGVLALVEFAELIEIYLGILIDKY